MTTEVILPAHKYLDSLDIPYQRLTFSPAIEKGAASVAQALGYEEQQMVKTLIFQSGIGERVLVMVGGDQKVISGLLKKAIGHRNVKMARPNVVLTTTGYEIGSIPPFHWQSSRFRSFVEQSLMAYEVLGVGAGERGHEIMIAPADLVRASRAMVVNLTDRSKPVFSDEGEGND